MISKQTKDMAQFFASVTEEASKPGLDLTTIRDIYEKLHLAATEPEGVSYAEVDVDGVPALWFMPKGCDANRVLLRSHGGGTVVFSMHLDRKAVGHIAKAAGVRALVLDYRRSPEYKFPAQIEDVEKAYHWLLGHGIRPENIATTGQSIGGDFAVSLALALRSKRVVMPAAILSGGAMVQHGAKERDDRKQCRERQASLEARIGTVSRVVARRHRGDLERSPRQSALRRSYRASANPGILRRT